MVKQGDFVTIHFTGKLPEGGVFDTTRAEVATSAGITAKNLGPRTICIGEGMVIRGVDAALEGKSVGTFTLELGPEDAFGKKDTSKLQVIPTQQLGKQGIRPVKGLELTIDGEYGVVKMTGGGRTIVDFNHPLAGQKVVYEVEILEEVTDPKAQIAALLAPLGIPADVVVDKTSATITLPAPLPQPLMDLFHTKITTLTPITTVSFESGEKPKKTNA